MSAPAAFPRGGGRLGAMMHEHDWATSPLGPPAGWPAALRVAVDLMLGSRFSMWLGWGPELSYLYNDRHVEILRGKHPAALGRPLYAVWPEIRADIAPLIDSALAGEAVWNEDLPLLVHREGRDEQAWFTFSFSPLRDEAGRVLGVFCATYETTAKVLAQARTAFRLRLEERLRALSAPEDVLAAAAEAIGRQLGAGRVAYVAVDPTGTVATVEHDWGDGTVPAIVGRHRLADFGPDLAASLRRGEMIVVEDVRRDPRTCSPEALAAFAGAGVAAFLDLPLVKDGRLVAMFTVNAGAPRAWPPDDVALAQELAERTWSTLERARAEAALREANATLEGRVAARTAELSAALDRLQQEVLERELAEEQLRQSQKLDALGQLTGGVAHDFNNLLTIIRSASEFMQRPDLPAERRQRYLDAIAETVDRAAKLVGQLLAFARRQPLRPERFDVGRQLERVAELLGPLLGSRVRISLVPADPPCFVRIDVAQFETTLLNLATNARDAMNGEGELTIQVEAVDAVPPLRHHGRRPGAFVAVTVADTGAGIAADRLARIFEPFYTTKEAGKGTGLGLSQVYGFAKQSHGDIAVRSAPGRGTTFTLYLPRVEGAAAPEAVAGGGEEPRERGRGTRVLVVEDNAAVGQLSSELLQDLGYDTVWAANAREALALLSDPERRFDLVFSDVVMPGMDGLELARTIQERFAGLPVVLATGYSDTLAAAPHGLELIRKPYSIEALARALRKAAATPT